MSFESFIGLRYLRARKSSRFLSTVTLISVGGVAVGVCALIVVLSVMAGFEEELRDRIIGANAHGNLLKMTYGFPEYRDVTKTMESFPEIAAASPFVLREVMITSESNVTGALLKGIDPASAMRVTDLAKQLQGGSIGYLSDPDKLLADTKAKIAKEQNKLEKIDERFLSRTKRAWGDKPIPGIVIGAELAKYLGVWVGDEVNVVNPLGGGLGPTGPIPSSQYFRVAAVFFMGMFEYDMKFAFVTLPVLQKFSSMDDEITAIEFKVKPDYINQTQEIGDRVVAKLGGFPYKIRDWKDMNKNLLSALKLEQLVMFIILTFITLVAAFNIASTLIMMVIEKGREIAILKSMGASNRSIMRIFMIYGLVIGWLGTLIGLVSGLLLCALVPYLGLQLDPEVYYMPNLPVKIIPWVLGVIVLSALSISWLATLYPAWKATRVHPVEGLRND